MSHTTPCGRQFRVLLSLVLAEWHLIRTEDLCNLITTLACSHPMICDIIHRCADVLQVLAVRAAGMSNLSRQSVVPPRTVPRPGL